jgi:RimJ/RimL family protein N-acetyltransferase
MEQIKLYPITMEDSMFLLDLRHEVQQQGTIIENSIGEHEQEEWVENAIKKDNYFIIVNANYESVGTIGMFAKNRKHSTAKWMLRVDPIHQRKGYGSAAVKEFLKFVFDYYGINKLMGDCFTDNVAEIANLTKLGFRQEGVWKEHYWHKGEFKDSIQFVMLKSEYDQLKAAGKL